MAKMKWMKPVKPQLHVVSLSGGKDSTAMLLRMLEEGMRVDIILFCDTGLEYPQMYEHLDKLEQNIGRLITRIRSDHTFEYYLTQKEVLVKKRKNRDKRNFRGYGWSGPLNRWCTKELKAIPRERFLKPLLEKYEIIEYVGLAADEGYRLDRENNKRENNRHPLIDWGMTEADCLKFCYDRGYDWGGLYEKFSRVSCWCCPCSRCRSCGSCTVISLSSGQSWSSGTSALGEASRQIILLPSSQPASILKKSGRSPAASSILR